MASKATAENQSCSEENVRSELMQQLTMKADDGDEGSDPGTETIREHIVDPFAVISSLPQQVNQLVAQMTR